MNSGSTLDVKKKTLYGIVIGVRQRPADDGTGRPAHGLFRILLENRCVHVMDDRLYQDCRDRFNNARRVVKREAAMQVLLQDYQRHERERALYASVWDQPTGLATLVAGGTVSDLQSVAPVGCDVPEAVSKLEQHIRAHLSQHGGEMGTLLNDECRSDVMFDVADGSNHKDIDDGESRAFWQFRATQAPHSADNQRCDPRVCVRVGVRVR